MPDRSTIAGARKDKREGKSPSTQAGEFVRQEIDHIRAGKHGARSTKQAIAIGLSEARQAGVKLPAPRKGTTSAATRRQAARESRRSAAGATPSPGRSRGATKALKHEGKSAASPAALSRQAHRAAAKRTPASRRAAARQSARTRARQKKG